MDKCVPIIALSKIAYRPGNKVGNTLNIESGNNITVRKIKFLTPTAADLHLCGGAVQLGADDAHGDGARGRDLPGGQRRGVQHLQEQDGGGQVQLQGAQPAHLPGHYQLTSVEIIILYPSQVVSSVTASLRFPG